LSKKTIAVRFKVLRIWPLNNKAMDEKLGPNKIFIDVKIIWDEATYSKEDDKHIHEEEKMDHESQWVVG
jgi:hypothetical protein